MFHVFGPNGSGIDSLRNGCTIYCSPACILAAPLLLGCAGFRISTSSSVITTRVKASTSAVDLIRSKQSENLLFPDRPNKTHDHRSWYGKQPPRDKIQGRQENKRNTTNTPPRIDLTHTRYILVPFIGQKGKPTTRRSQRWLNVE